MGAGGMNLEFATAASIVFGAGSLVQLGAIAAGLGKCAFVLVGDPGAGAQAVYEQLEARGIRFESLAVSGEPTIESVQRGVEAARRAGCDLVIGFGGGSVLDTGKAISALLTNVGDILDYLEVVGRNLPLLNAAAAFIAIPTTAGTGSEVTRNAVLGVPEQRVKVSLRSPLMLPRVALVDAELTYELPAAVTASTGMDALAQVLEPYVSIRANWMTDMFCRDGILRAARSLPRAFHNGADQKARQDMSWVSLLGGLALANSGLGAVHGFAAPLGGMFQAPHGAICARLLPPVVAMNIRALEQRQPESQALHRYREISRWLTGSERATVADGVKWLEDLCEALEIPRLSHYGVRAEDISDVVKKAASASSMKANPLPLTVGELSEILMRAL